MQGCGRRGGKDNVVGQEHTCKEKVLAWRERKVQFDPTEPWACGSRRED